MNLSRQQRDKMWGEDCPYSQVQETIETRILANKVSRRFLVVSLNINPLTFETVRDHAEDFAFDSEISGILEHAEYRGLGDGYEVCSFSAELLDENIQMAHQRAWAGQAAIIRMHEFVVKKLGLELPTHQQPRTNLHNLQEIFSLFLQEQHRRLSEKTFLYYESSVDLFEKYLDAYAHVSLEEDEIHEWEKVEKDGVGFTKFFGTEILSLADFLGFIDYFLARKVMSGNETLKRYKQAIIALYRWLVEKSLMQTENLAADLRVLRETSVLEADQDFSDDE